MADWVKQSMPEEELLSSGVITDSSQRGAYTDSDTRGAYTQTADVLWTPITRAT